MAILYTKFGNVYPFWFRLSNVDAFVLQKKDGSIASLRSALLILHGLAEPGGCLRQKPHRRYLNEELISKIIDKKPEFMESEGSSSTSGLGSWLDSTFGSVFEDVV